MGRVGQAEEIANAIVWLLSDEASFISGVTLDASGGGFVFGKSSVARLRRHDVRRRRCAVSSWSCRPAPSP